MAELEKTQETFGIANTTTPGKSDKFCEIEAVTQFVFEQVMSAAAGANTIKTLEDLDAAAMLCVVLVRCMGRNGDLSKRETQVLQGTVPGIVFPRTLEAKLSDKTAGAIAKAIVRYTHQIGRKKFRRNVERVEENLTQFLTHRKPEYYTTLAGDITRFH